jgi:hypothetical protein
MAQAGPRCGRGAWCGNVVKCRRCCCRFAAAALFHISTAVGLVLLPCRLLAFAPLEPVRGEPAFPLARPDDRPCPGCGRLAERSIRNPASVANEERRNEATNERSAAWAEGAVQRGRRARSEAGRWGGRDWRRFLGARPGPWASRITGDCGSGARCLFGARRPCIETESGQRWVFFWPGAAGFRSSCSSRV